MRNSLTYRNLHPTTILRAMRPPNGKAARCPNAQNLAISPACVPRYELAAARSPTGGIDYVARELSRGALQPLRVLAAILPRRHLPKIRGHLFRNRRHLVLHEIDHQSGYAVPAASPFSQPSCLSIFSATRSAFAAMVSDGFIPALDGKNEASTT